MGNLDNMLENQQKQRAIAPKGKSLLMKLSKAYMWIGCIVLILGFIVFINGVSDPKDKADAIGAGIGIFFGGLFTIFAGCIGEAIDDIRNNTKK